MMALQGRGEVSVLGRLEGRVSQVSNRLLRLLTTQVGISQRVNRCGQARRVTMIRGSHCGALLTSHVRRKGPLNLGPSFMGTVVSIVRARSMEIRRPT